MTAPGHGAGVVERVRRWSRRRGTSNPVVICPYVHPGDDEVVARSFAIGSPETSHITFDVWCDEDRIGPERAFQFLWNRHPGRDIIIVHTDMAPAPGQAPAEWYDALVAHAAAHPGAGMIAADLYYPATEGEADLSVVQCAGGTFDDGAIGHIRGAVHETGDAPDTVPAALLEKVRSVPWVTFGGVLIRRSVIDACGPIDERYKWAYVMDVDYCFEARSRGFELLQVPVPMLHDENRTTASIVTPDEMTRRIADNMALFYDKWRDRADELRPVS